MKASPEVVASPASRYMPQLDSLRAFAVFAVLYFHFFQLTKERGLLPGYWGVTVFFVLSGYLITGILLKSRDDIDRDHNLFFHLKRFYIRRTLRIFPLYYVVVLIGALLALPGMRDDFWWNLTYTSNIYTVKTFLWDRADLHFWTLSIEEQFYLLWPIVVLFLPRKYLVFLISGAIALAVSFRVMVYFNGLSSFLYFLTIAHLDSLAAGALLAIWQYRKPLQFENTTTKTGYNWLGYGLIVFALIASAIRFSYPIMEVAYRILTPWAAFWIVHRTAIGFTGPVGNMLESKPLVGCGKISYGVYVYHLPLRALVVMVCDATHINLPNNLYFQTALFSGLTLLVSMVSWRFFEKPINDLKRYFSYEQDEAQQPLKWQIPLLFSRRNS